MKSIIRKAVSVSAAAVMVSAFAVQAGAVIVTDVDTVEYQFNEPYLNINVDGGEIDLSEIDFTLKNSGGEVVAKWKGGSEKFAEVAEGLYDISNIENFYPSNYWKLPWAEFDKTELQAKYPNGEFYSDYNPNHLGHSVYNGNTIYPIDKCSYVYFDAEKYSTGKTMTVPANTIMLDAAGEYKTNGDDYSCFWLSTYADDNGNSSNILTKKVFSEYAGDIASFSIPEGQYKWIVDGSYAGGVHATSYNTSQEYIQVKLNMKDLFSDSITDNFEFVHDTDAGIVNCPTRGNKNTGANVSFAFLSGSVVTAAIPDSEGNIYVWVNTAEPSIQSSYTFTISGTFNGKDIHSFGGGRGISDISTYRSQLNINAKFEFPESGLTLYDIPADDYTVEIDSTEYTLENNTISVTDTKDMQKMNVVLKNVEPSSSETSSETSSSEVSSSEASSEVSSSEASSSQSSSSEVTSSDNTSSVTDSTSSTSSKSSSSSSKAANTNNTANPSTGAAAGFAGMALIAGAAVVVSKKNHK